MIRVPHGPPRRPTSRLVSGVLLVSVFGAPQPTPNRKPTYGRFVAMGADVYRSDHTCVILGAFLTAGDFFEGVNRIERHDHVEFRKGQKVLRYFPSTMTVKLEAHVDKCTDAPPETVVPDGGTLLEGLHFEAHWKRGVQTRRVESLSSKKCERPQSQLDPTSALARAQRGIEDIWRKTWICELTVEDTNVPLTDHLIITVSPGGTNPLRFSAQL
jgi:hypothetical protein